MKTPNRVEQVFHFLIRHLLAIRPVAYEESSAKRVGLAFLRRHDHAQDRTDALDFHRDRRVRRPCSALHPRL